MVDLEKLDSVIKGYKEYFPSHWKDEKYKWEAVKCFKEHWDIDAPNFGEMFKSATEKVVNLLDNSFAYPKTLIINFANADENATRQMFRNLYEGTEDLAIRIEEFQSAAKDLWTTYLKDSKWKKHYQNTNAISTYLWLYDPDKYFIYKYEIVRDVAGELETKYRPKRDGSIESMLGGYKLYSEICDYIQKDSEIRDMVSAAIENARDCDPDTNLHTTTIDVGFYLSRFYLNSRKGKVKEEGWFPEDYTPDITADEWSDLLNNSKVFTLDSLKILKRMKDYGGKATCKQLSVKYGGSANFYIAGSVNLAQRVADEMECPLPDSNTENAKWWPILYVGKPADKGTDGTYIWKLRDELAEALETKDLSDIPLYEDPAPSIWKVSMGDIPEDQRILFRGRNVVVVHGETRAKASSKVSQGESFIDAIKKGDFFYLCYGNSIQLLGRFTADKAEINPEKEDGWYQRGYEVIRESLDTSAYTNKDKWWAPNDNSTCIKVDDSEKPLFEELILKPYFGMTIEELYGYAEETHNYWWLTANPKIWSFSNLKIGEEQAYTLYNKNGNKRKIFQNFLDAKEGDLVIGYEANPVKKIVALCKITQASDGECIHFEKTEGLTSPIEYAALKDCPELSQMQVIRQPNGSLFKLTKGEYDFIMDMIREDNPLKNLDKAPEKYDKEDFLNEVYMEPERYDVLRSLLLNKMNVILQGAPGVGKTFTAKRLAYSIMGEKDDFRIEFIQFHQNYSYEDFIMGYRPDGSDFKLTEGIFYHFCQKAANDPDRKYFFIIDEINRGNLSKIFGELLMLIEKDYRKEKATLAYTGAQFSVPQNLYIIGMMNTADRSLAMIDYALRRRFSFFEIEPGFDSEGFRKYQAEVDNETFNALIAQIKLLNEKIKDDRSLGKGFMIGHSYFCDRKPEEWTIEGMKSVVEFDIIPMLSEYWFDDPDTLSRWENNLRDVFK